MIFKELTRAVIKTSQSAFYQSDPPKDRSQFNMTTSPKGAISTGTLAVPLRLNRFNEYRKIISAPILLIQDMLGAFRKSQNCFKNYSKNLEII